MSLWQLASLINANYNLLYINESLFLGYAQQIKMDWNSIQILNFFFFQLK